MTYADNVAPALPGGNPTSTEDRLAVVCLSAMESLGEGSSAKASAVGALLAVKRRSGKSYGQIAAETGLTNVYVSQLLRRQAQLKPGTAPALRAALPELSDEMVGEMMRPPMRSYDPNLIQEPAVYRLHEAVMHFGESIKEIINEDFGDGMQSGSDVGWDGPAKIWMGSVGGLQ
ncbi:hypothetical protein Taro_037172 [Colocasia esculenta]|uniref:Cyanate lyase C-terminal domain-containing protein n=1 Tax=Colocasia esculenta TaxID=4460 RepID=A0A843VZP6_COLES|nr:hypothetical protein [Colocasia esculenta]